MRVYNSNVLIWAVSAFCVTCRERRRASITCFRGSTKEPGYDIFHGVCSVNKDSITQLLPWIHCELLGGAHTVLLSFTQCRT